MFQSFEIIISDTSCLILLGKIGELEILKTLNSPIYITPEIRKEFGKALPEWIKVKAPQNSTYQNILEMDIDSGEASAIALSLEFQNSILIVDDLKARKIAQKLKLRYAGSLGVILRAKQIGAISSVTPIINKIKETNFRISNQLLDFVIEQAGE
jgi:predicted nucleic acid-binding protein